MKHSKYLPFLRRAAAMVCALSLTVPAAYAAREKTILETEIQIVDGLSYLNTVSLNSAGSRVESFLLQYEPGEDAEAILLPSDGTIYGASTISSAVSYAQGQGYHVLAAMNTDFFSSSSGIPLGLVIQNGEYQSSPENESAILIDEKGKFQLCEEPVIEMTLTNARSGQEITPHHFNKLRTSSGGIYLLNDDFSTVSTRASGTGWYVLMKPVEEDAVLTVDCEMEMEVTEMFTYGSPIAIREGEYVLTADNRSGYGSVYQSFAVGDRVTLTTTCDDEDLQDAQWASGCGDILVKNKNITDSSSWDFKSDGRNPRTALGVKSDGTVILYAVDGRRSGYSVGLTEMELAEQMEDAGCKWAVNLDGGGSTALSLWVPGQETISVQNRPSDGSERKCASYLLLVTDKDPNGKAKRAAMVEDGLVVLEGSSVELPNVVTIDRGLAIVDDDPSSVKITAKLGTIEDGIYTAKKKSGTDTLKLKAGGVSGTATIHVVDELTELTVKCNGESVEALTLLPGDTVTLTATGSYYGRTALRDLGGAEWKVDGKIGEVDEDGVFTAGADEGKGSLTISAGNLKKTISVTVEKPRTEVPIASDHWAYDAVNYCNSANMLDGMDVEGFDWDSNITRAQFVLALYNTLGQPGYSAGCNFTDVSLDDYYYDALSWGQELGIAAGMGDGTFAPNGLLTREQAFTLLRRGLPQLGIQCQDAAVAILAQYNDAASIADYAKPHIATLTIQGLVNGTGGAVEPQGNLTWAQTAALLYRLSTFTPVTADVETAEVTALCLAADHLNVRLSAAADAKIISGIPGGTQVIVTEQLEGWYQVFFTNAEGQLVLGYASADYLELQ